MLRMLPCRMYIWEKNTLVDEQALKELEEAKKAYEQRVSTILYNHKAAVYNAHMASVPYKEGAIITFIRYVFSKGHFTKAYISTMRASTETKTGTVFVVDSHKEAQQITKEIRAAMDNF